MITGISTLSGDPAGDFEALAEARCADIGEPGISTDDAAGADEQGFAACPPHDPRMSGGRRMQDRQHLVTAMDQLLQASGTRVHNDTSPHLLRSAQRGLSLWFAFGHAHHG